MIKIWLIIVQNFSTHTWVYTIFFRSIVNKSFSPIKLNHSTFVRGQGVRSKKKYYNVVNFSVLDIRLEYCSSIARRDYAQMVFNASLSPSLSLWTVIFLTPLLNVTKQIWCLTNVRDLFEMLDIDYCALKREYWPRNHSFQDRNLSRQRFSGTQVFEKLLK